jgi:uncharacterized protein YprB with RNaseH-like and TPR domain/predicted nuclease with RNAse H fold
MGAVKLENSSMLPTSSPQMIRKSFIFVPGVGDKTEQYLWRRGVTSWSQLSDGIRLPRISSNKTTHIRDFIRKGTDALRNRDIDFFAQNLPQSEHWRLYRDFRDRTLFLDVETTGLSRYYDDVTLIGTFDGRESRIFVKDNNMGALAKLLEKYDVLVTFNGKLFDVPFIKKEFPKLPLQHVHLDLRFLLRSVGIGGPLKEIEQKLGIRRGREITNIGGREAAVLWSRFLKGDDEALRKLVMYNLSDTKNLKTLMDYCYRRKFQQNIAPKMNGGIYRSRTNQKAIQTYYQSLAQLRPRFSRNEVELRSHRGALNIFSNGSVLAKVDRRSIHSRETTVANLLRRIKARSRKPSVVGIDLSGSKKRPTGICVLSNTTARLSLAFTDQEIVQKTVSASPSLVSIDSPLSLPKGRTCTRDNCRCRRFGIMREIERILKKRGINVYPCLIPSMQGLTKRGMALAKTLRKRRMFVIESYPGAAQDILGFPRKRVDLADLQADLANTGIFVSSDNEPVSHHEVDALTSALVGYFYLADMYEGIGNKHEGRLIIPRLIAEHNGNGRPRTESVVSKNKSISIMPSQMVAATSH